MDVIIGADKVAGSAPMRFATKGSKAPMIPPNAVVVIILKPTTINISIPNPFEKYAKMISN